MLGVQERSTSTTLLSRKIPGINRWPDWEALRALKDVVPSWADMVNSSIGFSTWFLFYT